MTGFLPTRSFSYSEYDKIPTHADEEALVSSGGAKRLAQVSCTHSKWSNVYRLRYLILLVILSICQFIIGPSIPYIINTFFASAHGGGDCAVVPKSKPCRMGAADAAVYHGYSDAASNIFAMLIALGNGSYSDAIGRRPLIQCAALMWLVPLFALAFHMVADLTLWVYLTIVPILLTFDLNGVYMAIMSDLIPEPEERAAAFGLYMAVILTVSGFLMPLAFLVPQRVALVVSIIGAIARIVYLFTVFPETSPRKSAPEDRSGLAATVSFAFQVLTRHSFIFRMTCILMLAGLGLSGYLIVLPPFMTGYLGFERVHKLMLFMAMGTSMALTFMFILSPLTRHFGEVRVLQMSLECAVFFPMFCMLCTRIWHLVLLVGIFAGPLTMSYPVVVAIKSNLVKQDEQGLVQGAIASIAKGVATIGFIFFSLLFKYSTKGGEIKSQRSLYVPFFTIAFIFSLAFVVACMLPLTPPPPPDKSTGSVPDVQIELVPEVALS